MPQAGFEPAAPATERPQTYARPRGHWDRLKQIHQCGFIQYSKLSVIPQTNLILPLELAWDFIHW
jgi:hypothetical protein